jgi:hypothetical protein
LLFAYQQSKLQRAVIQSREAVDESWMKSFNWVVQITLCFHLQIKDVRGESISDFFSVINMSFSSAEVTMPSEIQNLFQWILDNNNPVGYFQFGQGVLSNCVEPLSPNMSQSSSGESEAAPPGPPDSTGQVLIHANQLSKWQIEIVAVWNWLKNKRSW